MPEADELAIAGKPTGEPRRVFAPGRKVTSPVHATGFESRLCWIWELYLFSRNKHTTP